MQPPHESNSPPHFLGRQGVAQKLPSESAAVDETLAAQIGAEGVFDHAPKHVQVGLLQNDEGCSGVGVAHAQAQYVHASKVRIGRRVCEVENKRLHGHSDLRACGERERERERERE